MAKFEALKFTREDKSEVTIVINTYDTYTGLTFRLSEVYIRGYRKKNRESVKDKYRDDYMYRRLDTEQREKFILEKLLEVVTFEQIQQAMQNAWQMCKPIIQSKEDIDVHLGI